MASIFKQQYTMIDPKTKKKVKKKSKYWYIDYKGPDGIRKRVKAYKDKQATDQLAARLEKEAERADSGMADRFKEHLKTPLLKHLEDFRASLEKKGNSAGYVKQTMKRKMPSFSEHYYGYNMFSDVLKDAAKKGFIEVEKDQRSGTLIVTNIKA